ncbi:MAG TPA: BadF/BadG/BcrA/BcrD ATPase family protein [Nocardioidaceae bacterium]|nr:BadF/BadG/BcrA/BcrD ATPase family protein [Nocardioidaceae bacterium]
MTATSNGAPAAVLAIDAGNSKTDLAIIGLDGAVRGTARGDGFRPHHLGATGAINGLVPLVAKAAAEAGLPALGNGILVEHVSACLANADLPLEQRLITQAIDAQGWGRTSEVVNDTFALLRAGGEDHRGIAVVCGAGINCAGLLPDGRTATFAAVGEISGDWGGGGGLWQEAMWWAARAEDGRGDETQLRVALPSHFELSSMQALIEAVHLGVLRPERCHEMNPVLFEVAESGDRIAGDIVQRQAHEVVTLAVAAMRRLEVLDEPIDVLLGGGVLTAGHPLLMRSIASELHEVAPHAVTRVVTTPPVIGAGLLGLDRIDASDEAHETLRSSLRR